MYASSSSVYGANTQYPYCESEQVDKPLSLYAATKKSNELMAHSYCHLFKIPMTGLRYFTAYGPWGRPDMAPMKFCTAIMKEEPIAIYNNGDHKRDFTYIDDIVKGTILALDTIPDSLDQHLPYRVYNLGYGSPVDLLRFIELLEEHLGRKAIKEFLPKQPGDVDMTWADVSNLNKATGYVSTIPLERGIPQFVQWFRDYYI